MKLVAALAAIPALVRADEASDAVSAYCNQSSDPTSCNSALGNSAVASGVEFCMGKTDADDKDNCFSSLVDSTDSDDSDYATAEFAMNEFLEGINDDPMLQNVLSEINSMNAYLKDNGLTKSINPDGTPREQTPETAEMGDSLDAAKRFVELKQLVSWLQPKDKRISRYCFYGCWCLPEGAHSFVAGEGRPVDLVDKACQYLWFCYTCAKQEFRGVFLGKSKECTPDKQKYTFRFRYDKAHPAHYEKRDIICKDVFYNPMNTKDKWKSNCARAICECDRGLAKRLWRSWTHWDKSRHRIWSQKVVDCKQLRDCDLLPDSTVAEKQEKAACQKRGCLFIVKQRCLNGVSPGYSPDHAQICCGHYEDEGGRMEMRDHGGTHACCNWDHGTGHKAGFPWSGNWYNSITNCCANGKVENAGHPDC